MNYMIIGC